MTDAILTAQIFYIGFQQCDFTGITGLVWGHWNLSAPWGVCLTPSLWSPQNQLRGLTPALCGPNKDRFGFLSSKYLQVCVLGVRTDAFLPIPNDWFHLVLSFRKTDKVSEDIPWCLVSLEVSGWFLGSKFVPISWREVTHGNQNVFWALDSCSFSPKHFQSIFHNVCWWLVLAWACFQANASPLGNPQNFLNKFHWLCKLWLSVLGQRWIFFFFKFQSYFIAMWVRRNILFSMCFVWSSWFHNGKWLKLMESQSHSINSAGSFLPLTVLLRAHKCPPGWRK